ncbi:MAG: cytochrome C oxidase subunit IV family protein [Deltaproteobacteria bacterium]|nr:cytochrome C oxidase subunit IV family protein [Deltaproteobacteria bacterium]
MTQQHHADHKKSYVAVWIILLILSAITVWVAYHNYGIFNIVVAMGIATIKATLVCLYFMHLKYDNRVNQVVFAAAFVFLGIFVGLTASDELFRPTEAAAPVTAVQAPAGNQAGLMEKLRHSTAEQIAKGKEIYMAQCMACHGAGGKGDGPAGVALNPRPRDFTSGYWKQGGAPAQVFKTVSEGIAGTPMPPFNSLSIPDRWALVHFVRSLSPNTPSDTPDTLKLIGLGEGASAASSQALPEIPVDFAIDRMVKEKQ